MTPLWIHVHGWIGRPFGWGVADCWMVCADWVLQVRGTDPAAELRGAYDSRASCHEATGYFRDPLAVIADCLERVAGLQRGNDLRAGDVGMIRICQADGRVQVVGAIWMGDCWACKSPSGCTTIAPAQAEMIAFWSVGYDDAA